MILQYMRRHRRSLFVGMVAIFLIGIFVGLGGYLFTSRDMSESVAVVGQTKIPYMRFNARVNHYLDAVRQQGKDYTDDEARGVKDQMLRDMIVDEVLFQEATKMGLAVTDLELSAAIRSNRGFQRDGNFDPAIYFQAVRQSLRMSPEDYEVEQRKSMTAAKLKQLIFESSKLMPGELAEEYRRLKGSMKDFEKQGAQFGQELERARALDMINFFLRQVSGTMEIRTFLKEREQGL
ncbi:MAG: SurA N-terminal domain-containing protein [Elusimicrobia bacterium]|nr:SurA N-terminal domain-containing protein [Elusimicrobiota bacterium]